MEKILLDTDIDGDIDDAICLAYLLKERSVNCSALQPFVENRKKEPP